MGCRNGDVKFMACICCLLFVIPMVIITILSYVGLEPRFYIHSLYVPAFNISTNNASKLSNSIFIDLKFNRVVAYVPLRYEDINITLSYASNRSSPVARHVLPGFYQGHKRNVRRRAVVEAHGLLPIPGGSMVTLALEMNTIRWLKHYNEDGGWYYEKPKAVVVAAHVRLDASGNKASKKPVRLH